MRPTAFRLRCYSTRSFARASWSFATAYFAEALKRMRRRTIESYRKFLPEEQDEQDGCGLFSETKRVKLLNRSERRQEGPIVWIPSVRLSAIR
jgi:hypothetical protein